MAEIDWIIHFIGNGVFCPDCGKIENGFPHYICNAHTHGMEKYGHPDFQVVIHMSTQNIGYVLNLHGIQSVYTWLYRGKNVLTNKWAVPAAAHDLNE